jgi:hypothetical protein
MFWQQRLCRKGATLAVVPGQASHTTVLERWLAATRVRVVLVAALLCLGLTAASSEAAAPECSAVDDFSATVAPIFPSCFEAADGNMIADGPSPQASDWQSVVGSTVVTQDGTGATDDTFQGGAQEEFPSSWSLALSPSSPKDDVFFTAARVEVLSQDVFLDLGTILKAANGSFDESFELNQLSPGTPDNPTYRTATLGGSSVPLPARSTGDVLVTFDSNGGVLYIGLCTWVGDSSAGVWQLLDGTPLADTNTKTCTQLNAATAPTAQGAINASTIAAPVNPLSGADVTAGNFGELSIDLSKAVPTDGACADFSSLWMRTRSSYQVNSNPEDITLPQQLAASTCAPVAAVTLTSGAPPAATVGQPYSFRYDASSTPPGDTVTFAKTAGDVPDGLTLSSDGTLSGNPTAAGTFTYTVTGSTSATSASREDTITVVAAAPVVPTGTPPANTIISKAKINRHRRTAAFTFTATGASGFRCALLKPTHHPKATFSSCRSPKTYKHLKPGRYTFEVRGINSAGTGKAATKKFKI